MPWQMNKTLIINFSCSDMPYIAKFCVGLSTFFRRLFFSSPQLPLQNSAKALPYTSSQIVVSSEGRLPRIGVCIIKA